MVLTVTTISGDTVSQVDVSKFNTRWEARNSRDELLEQYEIIYDGGTDISDIRVYATIDGNIVIHTKITPLKKEH